jgi:hypothetical protein
MFKHTFRFTVAVAALAPCWPAAAQDLPRDSWQQEFDIAKCKFSTTGRNPYFILEPGYQLQLRGNDTTLDITVLDETKMVDGVNTRVVEEKEWKNGKLYEIARNYYAICEPGKDVFYFGEHVEFYENGKVVNNDGSWQAGVKGSKPGMIMPGNPSVKMKYYQEIAPGIAMDRAEVVSLSDTCKTPAGTFTCMKVREGSAMELGVTEHKFYARDIGLLGDQELLLVRHGPVKNK